jgi:hypothetical protein
VDADAFEELVSRAGRATNHDEELMLWQQAQALLQGEFLAWDQGSEWMRHRWIKMRQQALRMAHSRMVRHLADLYLQRGKTNLAEEVLEQLRAVETVEKEYQVWKSSRFGTFTQTDREAIVALGSDLPALWQAPTTPNEERKQMLRLVIREVIVDSKRVGGQVWVQINWQTGAQEQFWYQRRVSSYAVFAGTQALEQRARELNAAGLIDAQIAATLEREGYQTPGLIHPITSKIVCHLRAKWQIPTVKLNRNQHNPAQWEDGSYSVEGAAAKSGVDQSTIFNWLKTGKLTGEHLGQSMPWKIYVTEEDVTRLHEWLRRARRSKREAL